MFDPELAEMRFGCGLSPVVAPPASVPDMLARLTGPDEIALRFPVEDLTQFRERMKRSAEYLKTRRTMRGTPEAKIARKAQQVEKKNARIAQARWTAQRLLRRAWTSDGLRERLTWFWADHFTAVGKQGTIKRAATPHVEEAIRPHVTGRFADLLRAAITSPVMLHYLDQQRSMGPNSKRAQKKQGGAGLNENLAREVLELHTLGVDGPYSQADVRELAELFTGLYFDARAGFKFRKDFAEPGAERVLGQLYGSDKPNVADIFAVLDDLAVHPSTAAHVAEKLAVHFVADRPDPDLVAHLTVRFLDTDGDLLAVTEALLRHPAAWAPDLHNVKQPWEFMTSAARALAVPPGRFDGLKENELRPLLHRPLVVMGQRWESPAGPDGWPEDDSAWITPQGLAARMGWAMTMPARLQRDLPDPRDFVHHALGARAPEPVMFAAHAAENRREGVGLILSSPAFQRK
ncbi:DUF1800 domain-containing protein [Lutimaribacter sp. EGI FJ00015]|uniref:DUF1800 domain-containing protein n=1 Tax=Lutimaribacter degradans TaxID=2945989 RepID=A0ACC5ZV18_9RHOB|nr:DUF1800 domain-containing protein [Lutimaribacter sp. EGI FJ00013]MCM2561606.1 DUF1800 domain-containing protein [Lutimaribacter sp. EGI FJ00013]MCO0612683.1 DUF1800 domain-containing protein [Lutimaribacter sp. EGI FJ00015]MCO0635341.1 DUF1800 domain-containing protein [Lutimaribacter sp. EGI FJ00014]